MVGVPRISYFFRGAEPCIIMLTMPMLMPTMLMFMLTLLIGMLIMPTIKFIISTVRTMFLIIPCI